MNKIFEKLKTNSFLKNVLALSTGTAGAQLITMLASPLITRFYGPEAFGVLGAFSAIINIIVPIAALTYPIAIVLPKHEVEAKGLMKLSFIVSLIMSLITLLTLILFQNHIINILNLHGIANYLYLIPLVIIFASIMQIMNQWFIRNNKFVLNAKATFYQSVITNGSKVGFGYFYPHAFVLVVLTTLSYAIRALLMMLYESPSKLFRKSNKNNNISLLKLAKKYRDFPMFRAPESLITGLTHGIPTLMLTVFFGPATVGFYSIGRTVLSLPTQMVGNAVGDVFYPKITEAFNKGLDISKMIIRTTNVLLLISIIPFGTVILVGPILFAFVFGAEWVVAGEYARWIALWSITNFSNRPATRALAVINAQKFHLYYTVFGLVVRVLAIWLGFILFESDVATIAMFSIAGVFLNVGLILMAVYLSKRVIKKGVIR